MSQPSPQNPLDPRLTANEPHQARPRRGIVCLTGAILSAALILLSQLAAALGLASQASFTGDSLLLMFIGAAFIAGAGLALLSIGGNLVLMLRFGLCRTTLTGLLLGAASLGSVTFVVVMATIR